MNSIHWGAIENIAERLAKQAEGAEALLALAREMQQVEIQRREAGDRLGRVKAELAAAEAARDQAHAGEAQLLTNMAVLRKERDQIVRDNDRLSRGMAAERQEEDRLTRAEMANELASHRAEFDQEHARLDAELGSLVVRVAEAEAALAALKRA